MGVAAIEGVAAIDEVGVAAPGAVTGVDTGANEPLLLVSLKPSVTALKNNYCCSSYVFTFQL